MLIRSTAILLLLLLFWSCEEVVELDVDFDPAVVVVSEIAPNREARVALNRSRSILSQSPNEFVFASEVTILNRGNGRLTELFLQEPEKDTLNSTNNDFPYYASRETVIRGSNNYELNIKIDEEAPLSAITTIPQQVLIQSFNLIDFSQSSDPRDDDKFNIKVELDFNHDSRKAESYHLVFYFLYSVEQEFESDTVILNFLQTPVVEDLITSFQYTFDFENGVLIQGGTIAEGNHRIEANLSVNFEEEDSPFSPELWVELRNTNDDYHNYHFNLTRQLSQRDSIIPQAILVPTNINNGLGIFSGYNYDVQFVELPD